MATVNLGRIKPIWKGAWSSSVQYIADDIVSYNNSAWIANGTNANSAPSGVNANWSLMAQGLTAGSVTTTELADGAVTAAKLAAGAAVPSQTGNSGKFLTTNGSTSSWAPAGKILQVQHTHFDQMGWTGAGYFDVVSLNITPISASSRILLAVDMHVAGEPGHACQGRFLRDNNTFNLPSAGSRSPGHGGTELVNSDGGSSFHMRTIDTANTTSQITYKVQLGHENGSTVIRINTSSRAYADQGGYGYPGTYRALFTVTEISA